MRYPASLAVIVLAAVVIVVGLLTQPGVEEPAVAVADTETTVSEPAPVVAPDGGGGSNATQEVTEAPQQEWVRMPGTPVAIWPKPHSTSN